MLLELKVMDHLSLLSRQTWREKIFNFLECLGTGRRESVFTLIFTSTSINAFLFKGGQLFQVILSKYFDPNLPGG